MPTTPAADQLRCDIAILRAIRDAAVAADAPALVDAATELLRDRRARLESVEAAALRPDLFRAA